MKNSQHNSVPCTKCDAIKYCLFLNTVVYQERITIKHVCLLLYLSETDRIVFVVQLTGTLDRYKKRPINNKLANRFNE